MPSSVRVSFQGEFGAFSEQAAAAYFGKRWTPVPRENFRDVFVDVKRRRTEYGIVPIENSLFGSVTQNFDLLLEFPLHIVGELKLRIRMNLMALPGAKLKDIRHIYSHPQGLGQSDVFLQTLKHAVPHPYYDTAGAAKMIRETMRTDAAAIASEQAAAHYGLVILKRNTETDHRNFTRFLVIAAASERQRRPAKTSLIFATKNRPGSLHECLGAFAAHRINMLRIESRPFIGKPWDYLFYVDVQAGQEEELFRLALRTLRRHISFLKILGSYTPGKVVR